MVGRIVAAGDERPVLEIDERIEIDLAAKEFESVKTHPFAFQDIVPLLPGSYQANLAVRNLVSKEFGVVKGEFEVPGRARARTRPVADHARRCGACRPTEGGLRPFQVGERAWYPAVDSTFPLQGEMEAVFQVDLPDRGPRARRRARRALLRRLRRRSGEEVIASFERVKLNPAADHGIAVGALRAAVARPAVRELPAAGRGERRSRREGLALDAASPCATTRPWRRRGCTSAAGRATRRPSPCSSPSSTWRSARTRPPSRSTGTRSPVPRPRTRRGSVSPSVELRRKDFAARRAAIAPLDRKAPQSYAFLLQGLALSGMGKSGEAIAAYERALGESPQSTRILNVLAEEYLRSGTATRRSRSSAARSSETRSSRRSRRSSQRTTRRRRRGEPGAWADGRRDFNRASEADPRATHRRRGGRAARARRGRAASFS